MDELKLNELLKNGEKLNERINFYLRKEILVKQDVTKGEILGHIEKAEHNINFVADVLEGYSDWAIVGCYYASYHIALALALKKGFSSKNHDATLCVLIKYYYDLSLNEEDLELLNEIYLSNQDILFYAHSKEEREKASYSTQINFDNKSVSELRKKTLAFVNKCREILKDEKDEENKKDRKKDNVQKVDDEINNDSNNKLTKDIKNPDLQDSNVLDNADREDKKGGKTEEERRKKEEKRDEKNDKNK